MGNALLYIILLVAVVVVLSYGIMRIGKKKDQPQGSAGKESISAPARNEEFERLQSRCRNAVQEFAILRESYICYKQWHKYRDTYAQLNQAAIKLRGARAASTEVREFLDIYGDLHATVQKSNADFVLRESRESNSLFSGLEGKSLDAQQREAVVTDEDHTLVIAGAGSGKTLTVAAKVKYLCERKGVSPEDILLISYTNKAADEMTDRINRLGVDVKAKTFHSLGLGIIGDTEGQKPPVFNRQSDFIRNYFSKKVFDMPEALRSLIQYLAYFMDIPLPMEKLSDTDEPEEYECNKDLETLKSKYYRGKQMVGPGYPLGMGGERVRSAEELMIANYLFLHGVEYRYEQVNPFPSNSGKGAYRPDFYLPDYDIYYEHFGINKEGRTPQYSPENEKHYIDVMQWKRQQHSKNRTTLIETYSWQNKEGILLESLEKLLLQHGVKFVPRNDSEIYKSILLCNKKDRSVDEFSKLCLTFLNLFKSAGYKPRDLKTLHFRSGRYNNPYHHLRLALFKKVIEPVMRAYEEYLNEAGEVDFSDMIIHATDLIRKGTRLHPYKYVIVDEYQDISVARYQLLKAILEQTGAHLLCVGDDWQSVYRFSGSDIGVFTGFEKTFTGTKILKIEQTYRNSRELIQTAGSFIMRNPAQIKKNLRSSKSLTKPVQFYIYKDSFSAALRAAVEDIVARKGANATVMLLGRTKYDLRNVKETGVFYKPDREKPDLRCPQYPSLKACFYTAHGSKGLESEDVILLNFNDYMLGFPNKIQDDPLLEVVLSDADTYLYSEERRLLYVALTRTKNRVYILTSLTHSSEFFKEFVNDPNIDIHYVDTNKPVYCPKCKTGLLTERFGSTKFVGCSNFPKCDFTTQDLTVLTNPVFCPKCKALMLCNTRKHGSKYYSCTNHPKCRATIEIK